MSKNPLAEKRIVITRSVAQAAAFARQLAAQGAHPVCFPVIRFQPLADPRIAAAIRMLDQFDWLIFTSVNAVNFFYAQLAMLGCAGPLPQTAVVGSATAAAHRRRGGTIAYMPAQFTGPDLVAGLGDLQGQTILLPRARRGRPDIVRLLQQRGAIVRDIPLYETVTASPSPDAWAALKQPLDALTFTSPSSVRNFLKIVGTDWPPLAYLPLFCIGPTTAAAATNAGLTVTATAAPFSIPGLIAAMVAYWQPQP